MHYFHKKNTLPTRRKTMYAALLCVALLCVNHTAQARNSQGIIFQRATITIYPKDYQSDLLLLTEAETAPTQEQGDDILSDGDINANEGKPEGKADAAFTNMDATTAAQTPAMNIRQPIELTVNIRPEQSLSEEGLFQINRLNEGLMVVFDYVSRVPLIPMNIYTPKDILFVDEQGVIIQIAPSIKLAYLQNAITTPKPIRAFAFFAGGTVERLGIKPGDVIEHAVFAPPPFLLQ